MKKRVLAALLCLTLAMTLLAGCGSKDTASEDTSTETEAGDTSTETETDDASTETEAEVTEKGTIRVGGKFSNESKILSELYSLALEDNGYTVDRTFPNGEFPLTEVLQKGTVDIYPELTGIALTEVLDGELLTDKQEIYDYVSKEYKERWNLIWLEPTDIEDKIGMVMLKERAEELGITNLSELQEQSAGLVFCKLNVIPVPEGDQLRMDEYYGTFEYDVEEADVSSELWGGLEYGYFDAALVYVTSLSRNLDDKYIILDEDIPVFPAQYAAPVIRGEILEQYPEIEDIINKVSAQLTTEKMVELLNKDWNNTEEFEAMVKDFYETNCK
jgi:osmoprotectant transport system substrate-binding protein